MRANRVLTVSRLGLSMINGKIRSQLSSLNNVDLTDRVTVWRGINPTCIIEDNTSLTWLHGGNI
jgi:hypothetical protein